MTGSAQYLRAAEIARHLGISERTVRRWIAAGELPSVKLGGSRLVAKADLERVLSPAPQLLQEPEDEGESELDKSTSYESIGKAFYE